MRPLRLEFQAFGSYPGAQTVDFEVLAKRGLFVVAGPTGTGKTTVFDAMVYALYGVLPGQRSRDSEPRSHHAAPDVETVVTFDFEVNGSRYRVQRQPQWERPKKRGEGTTIQNAKATLVKLVGDETESLATQANTCTHKCGELIGLDATQFQRVVLLPQGKFTEFLLSTDDDRETLLRRLFGGELYERVVSWLKKHAEQLDEQVGEVDREVQRHRKNALDSLVTVEVAWLERLRSTSLEAIDDMELGAAIEALRPVREERRKELEAIRAAATSATERKVTGETEATRYDLAEKARRKLAALEAEREDVRIAQDAADASLRARPVVKAADEVGSALRRAESAGQHVEDARAAITAGFKAMGQPMPACDAVEVATTVQQARQQLEAEQRSLDAARDAVAQAAATEAGVVAAGEAHAKLAAGVANVRDALAALEAKASALEPLVNVCADRRASCETLQQRVNTRTRLAVELAALEEAGPAEELAKSSYEALMARFVATQGARLVGQLKPGKPCPVCGATEHPTPAMLDDGGDTVDHGQVDTARDAWSKKTSTVTAHRAAAAGFRATLGHEADESVEHFHAALGAARQLLVEAQDASKELTDTRTVREQRAGELALAIELEQHEGRRLAGLEERARLERNDADQCAIAVAGIDAAVVTSNLVALASLDRVTAGLAARFDEVTTSKAKLDSTMHLLAEQFSASGYPAVEAAQRRLLESTTEEEYLQRAAAWKASLHDTDTRLRQLVEQGVPDTRPDVDALVTAAAAAEAAAKEASTLFTTMSNAVDAAQHAQQRVFKISADSADLRRRRDTARTVFKTCNGEGGIKVKLERWVLAGELERVTQTANVHLARMTTSRYKLARVKDVKGGLTLEVFDAHTGRARTTASLSGGEQFQASLALALGLADVVSHGGSASGRQFEALFVDEGFGSLDPDALDDAIAALSMLQAAGRVVGVITHVEAMKERMHVGIEVKRLPEGKGSTLVVNP